MPTDILCIWNTELLRRVRALDERSQRRELVSIQGVTLCSNDYLGLATNAALREAVLAAVQQVSKVGATGSRLLSGHTEEWRELEENFAQFAGTDAALFFSSGYLANVGLLSSMLGKDDVVYSDALNHASLIDGIRLSGGKKVIYPHRDLNALEDALRQDAVPAGHKVIVTESVFSMDGDLAPLREMASLAEKYGAALIVDEAHATGVHGAEGRGLAAESGILRHVLASIHTCGKALGCAGAFVCGSEALKEHLINHARTFIFSTALPPYFARQIDAALGLARRMESERRELLGRAARLSAGLRTQGFDTAGSASQIVPVVIGSNEDALDAAGHLQQDGFAVRAIRPPTVPAGTARLRLSLTIDVSDEDVTRLLQSLVAWRCKRQASVTARHA